MVLFTLFTFDHLLGLRHAVMNAACTSSIISHSLGLADCMAILAVICTLPMEVVLPSTRVATVGQAPGPDLTSPEDSVTLFQWCASLWAIRVDVYSNTQFVLQVLCQLVHADDLPSELERSR